MKQRLLLGSITLSLLLGGCASQPESQTATPAPELTKASPASPGQTAPSAEVKPGLTAKGFKFFTGDGEEFQSFEDIQKSVEFKIEDVPARADTINLVIERMEKAANYLPSEKTVRASLNKPTEQLTAADYMIVFEQYLSAHDVMFSKTSGDLYETLNAASRQAGYDHLISVAEGDEIPYAVKFTLHTNDTGLLISDNSAQNKVDDGALDQLGDYQLISADGGRDVVSENGNWYVAGDMELLKKAK